MSIQATCGGCGAKLTLKDEAQGRTVKCPRCQGKVPVPAERVVLPIALAEEDDPGFQAPAPAPAPAAVEANGKPSRFEVEVVELGRDTHKELVSIGVHLEIAVEHLRVIRSRVGWFFVIFIVIPLVTAGGMLALFLYAMSVAARRPG